MSKFDEVFEVGDDGHLIYRVERNDGKIQPGDPASLQGLFGNWLVVFEGSIYNEQDIIREFQDKT